LAADTIDLISEAQIPVLWLLDLPNTDVRFSPEDVIKYLVSQALRKNHALLNERSGALNAARYQSATSVEEWFALFGAVLTGLPEVYIIIDVAVLQSSIGTVPSWLRLFQQLFEALDARMEPTRLKIAFLCSRTSHRAQIKDMGEHRILQIPKTRCGRVTKPGDGRRSRKDAGTLRSARSKIKAWPKGTVDRE
jgi:hypothetical protein